MTTNSRGLFLRAPLIGRQQELTWLHRSFEAAKLDGTVVALVNGEPGVGKSRLIESFTSQAEQAGATVLHGGASEAEGMPPYLPFIEALGGYISQTPADILRTQLGHQAAVLAPILPEIVRCLGDLPASYPLPPEQARLRLYEGIGTFLASAARSAPLVLVLDDLQWADPASLDMLCYLVRRPSSAPILCLGAYRSGEADPVSRFQTALSELNRARRLRALTLAPLDEIAIAALARAYLGDALAPAIGARLFSQSEGNPFFAEELLHNWVETGVLVRHEGLWRMQETSALPSTLPPGILGAVQQRLGRFSPEVLDLLRVAAVAGRAFDASLVAGAVGLDADDVEMRLLEVVQTRLLQDESAGRFSFAHDKIRECLLAEITATRKRRLHGFIGRLLEATTDSANASHLADLAFHFAASGDRARGAAYALRMAAHALRAAAASDAVTGYRLALDLIAPDSPERGALLLDLGEAALAAGAEAEAVRASAAALEWFRDRGETVQAARAAHRQGMAQWRREAIPEARAAFLMAQAMLERTEGAELIQVLVDLGTLLAGNCHEYDAGIAHVRRAADLAERLGEHGLLARAGRALGNLLVRRNDLSAGIARLEQALELAVRSDDPVEAAECCASLELAYYWNSEVLRSEAVAHRRLAFAHRSHDPYQLRHVSAWLAIYAGIRGRWEEAERLVAEGQLLVDRLVSPEPRAWLQFVRGGLSYFHGDWDQAAQYFQAAIMAFRALGPGTLVWYLGFLAVVLAEQGKQSASTACVEELEGLLVGVPEATMSTAEPLSYLTVAALLAKDDARLTDYYPRLLPFQGQFHDVLVDRLLGQIEIRRGNYDRAENRLLVAEAIARREELPHELACVFLARADLVLAQGRRHVTEARALLRKAQEAFLQLGNVTMAQQLDRRIGSRAAGKGRGSWPAGLSAREVEVLRLIGAGYGNRRIAETLILSEKTVETHVASIYRKLQVQNRSAATAFAIRAGLVLDESVQNAKLREIPE